jgi:hypothetical protein
VGVTGTAVGLSGVAVKVAVAGTAVGLPGVAVKVAVAGTAVGLAVLAGGTDRDKEDDVGEGEKTTGLEQLQTSANNAETLKTKVTSALHFIYITPLKNRRHRARQARRPKCTLADPRLAP